MMTDFRALCAELLWALENAISIIYREDGTKHISTAEQVVNRARAALADEPTVPEVVGSERMEVAAWNDNKSAAELLQRLNPPQPVPVSERPPGPGDCTTNPRTGEGQWCWGWVQHDPIPYSGRWRMIRREWLVDEVKAWLPAHALPLPEVGE
jgi:hypothetical protein